MRTRFHGRILYKICDGNDSGAGTGDGDKGGAGAGTGDGDKKGLLTQEQFNAALAKERRQMQEKNKELLNQLEQIKKTAQLTEEEKTSLESQIEELRQRSMSADELAKQQVEKAKKEYDTLLETERNASKRWETNFKSTLVNNSLVDAAVKHQAHNPQQIIAVLRPNAKVVEKVGADGKPSGEFETRVMFQGKNDKGEPVTLDLTPEDAVKQMRELTAEYGNLFKDLTKGGVGAVIGQGQGGQLTSQQLANMTHEQYKKFREQNPNLVGKT